MAIRVDQDAEGDRPTDPPARPPLSPAARGAALAALTAAGAPILGRSAARELAAAIVTGVADGTEPFEATMHAAIRRRWRGGPIYATSQGQSPCFCCATSGVDIVELEADLTAAWEGLGG